MEPWYEANPKAIMLLHATVLVFNCECTYTHKNDAGMRLCKFTFVFNYLLRGLQVAVNMTWALFRG